MAKVKMTFKLKIDARDYEKMRVWAKFFELRGTYDEALQQSLDEANKYFLSLMRRGIPPPGHKDAEPEKEKSSLLYLPPDHDKGLIVPRSD